MTNFVDVVNVVRNHVIKDTDMHMWEACADRFDTF